MKELFASVMAVVAVLLGATAQLWSVTGKVNEMDRKAISGAVFGRID
jgi:hypothetical protein